MKQLVFALIVLATSKSYGAAVLIDDSSANGKSKVEEARTFLFGENRQKEDFSQDEEFEDAVALRSKRRVGVGVSTMGQMGLFAALVELNYGKHDAFQTGFGGGSKYSTYSFQWKHHFGGATFSPYGSLGYTHWYNATGNVGAIDRTTPGFLGSRYLSDDEKKSGRFAKDFFVPAVGVQVNQLRGPYVGSSLFAEIDFMSELSDPSPTTTASLGMMYYF